MGLGRPGSDADMAACILFLAGPGGVFLNSQVLYPDGGKSSALAFPARDTDPSRQHTRPACSYVGKGMAYWQHLGKVDRAFAL